MANNASTALLKMGCDAGPRSVDPWDERVEIKQDVSQSATGLLLPWETVDQSSHLDRAKGN